MNNCENCKHEQKHGFEEPCCECMYYDHWEGSEKPASDPVNHPSHYCQEGSMECIDEMVAVFGVESVRIFCLCNVWKYRKRAMFKNGEEDLKKADWYMKKFVELGGDPA